MSRTRPDRLDLTGDINADCKVDPVREPTEKASNRVDIEDPVVMMDKWLNDELFSNTIMGVKVVIVRFYFNFFEGGILCLRD